MDKTASPPTARYCRGCGYDLRACTRQCSECGRAFDPAVARTYRNHPASAARRWTRRGMAAILILAVAPAGTLGWLWLRWHSEDREIKSLDQNRCLSGPDRACVYPRLANYLPARLKFLADRITHLSLFNATDADLAHLARMTHMKSLSIAHSKLFTNAGLANLAGMTDMQHLDLMFTQVDDAGMAHLAGMRQMQWLYLSGTKVTDAGLAHLAKMTQMDHLLLSSTRISDAGLVHLKGMTQMTGLTLSHTQITDAGLAQLTAMPAMESLSVDSTHVSDAGLAHLASMKGVSFLYLRNTSVSDAGMAYLAGMTQLQSVDLQGTKLTESGASRLRAALPGASVKW